MFRDTAEAYEAGARIAARTFFGFMAYIGQIVTKPGSSVSGGVEISPIVFRVRPKGGVASKGLDVRSKHGRAGLRPSFPWSH